ncbi:hypothetical protein D3C80_859060 [compost metagenome]
MVVVDHLHRAGRRPRVAKVGRRQAVAGRESDEDVATGVFGAAADPCQPDTGPLRQARALVRQQRRVGGQGDDDRTHARLADVARCAKGRMHCTQHLADRVAGYPQGAAHTVVGLHQYADGPAAGRAVQYPRSATDTALEFVADHPGAAADATFSHRPRLRSGKRRVDMLGSDMLTPDVVEHAVVGFQYRGHAPVGARLAHLALGRHQRIADHTDAVGVGVGNRRGQQAGLANPLKASGIAIAVEYVHAGKARLQAGGLGPRLDHRDPGIDRVVAAAALHGVMADTHARHIGDGVERARGAHADTNAQITYTH